MLSRYAYVIVKVGLNVQPGQQVIIQAPVSTLPLVKLVTDEAYKAGASLVVPLLSDEDITISRFKNITNESYLDTASDWLENGIAQAFGDGAARLVILGNNPSAFKDIPMHLISRASKSASKAKSGLYKLVTGGVSNWSIASYATPEWASKVFPDMPIKEAVSKLWDAIYSATRVNTDNPIKAWEDHNKKLAQKCDYLNKMKFSDLHFYNDIGTDVYIGLAEGHIWKGGAKTTKSGIVNNSNIPTEEVFTTPHRSKINGIVKSTKPLYYNGIKVDHITALFKDGVATVSAKEGDLIIKNMIQSDPDACRLGEIALVPHSSPISASGIIFQETLYDENASCHIAFGNSYSQCTSHIEGETAHDLLERGANKSTIHVDWMIGNETTNVDAYDQKGNIIPLMRNGEWC